MYTTILFNILQGPTKSLRGYLALSNDATIKILHLNQELFIGGIPKWIKFQESQQIPCLEAWCFIGRSSDTHILLHKKRRKQRRKEGQRC